MPKPASHRDIKPKPVRWIGRSLEDLRRFPEDVRRRVGVALWEAQLGAKAGYAKPLKGFGGGGVLEIVEAHDGDAYRGVYTVKFANAVYVLHVFQKKSTKGIRTPRADIETVLRRLKIADADNRARMTEGRM